ncbi:MAG: hypothetical protein R3C16_13650 [Hyphomonadaceae bacterium]
MRKRSPHAPDEPLRLKFKGVWYEVSQPHEPGAPAGAAEQEN